MCLYLKNKRIMCHVTCACFQKLNAKWASFFGLSKFLILLKNVQYIVLGIFLWQKKLFSFLRKIFVFLVINETRRLSSWIWRKWFNWTRFLISSGYLPLNYFFLISQNKYRISSIFFLANQCLFTKYYTYPHIYIGIQNANICCSKFAFDSTHII